MNPLYIPTGAPLPDVTAYSSEIRAEFAAIGRAFDEMVADLEGLKSASQFAAIYQGSPLAAPAVRVNGTALQPGDMYFDQGSQSMRVWGGTSWTAIPTDLSKSATLAEVTSRLQAEYAQAETFCTMRVADLVATRMIQLATEVDARQAGDILPPGLPIEIIPYTPAFIGSTNTPVPALKMAAGFVAKMGRIAFVGAHLQLDGVIEQAKGNEVAMVSLPPEIKPLANTELVGGSYAEYQIGFPNVALEVPGLGQAHPYATTEGVVRFHARSFELPNSEHGDLDLASLSRMYITPNARIVFSGCLITAS